MSSEQDPPSIMHFITRSPCSTDESVPWDGIAFNPPLGTDELFHKLKAAYPACQNFRQRKHLATIQFLISEFEAMQRKDSGLPQFPTTADDNGVRYFDNDRHRTQDLDVGYDPQQIQSSESPSGSSSVHTPENVDPDRTLKGDVGTSDPITPITPTKEGEHVFVWRVDGQQYEPKSTKRKLTDAEKAVYRFKRQKGVCADCKRSKSRCCHVDGVPEVANSQPMPKHTANKQYSPMYVPPTSSQTTVPLVSSPEKRLPSPQSQVPQEHSPQGHSPQIQVPPGHFSHRQAPPGHFPHRQAPQDHFPHSQVPQDHSPQSQEPQGHFLQNPFPFPQDPLAAVRIHLPHDSFPYDQLPQHPFPGHEPELYPIPTDPERADTGYGGIRPSGTRIFISPSPPFHGDFAFSPEYSLYSGWPVGDDQRLSPSPGTVPVIGGIHDDNQLSVTNPEYLVAGRTPSNPQSAVISGVQDNKTGRITSNSSGAASVT